MNTDNNNQDTVESNDVLQSDDQLGLLFDGQTWSILRSILTPLASLRLTVALLILSVFVTWVATMQQTRMDIWDVKRAHFPAIVTPVDFEVLFPPAWFPEMNGVSDGEVDVAIVNNGAKAGSRIPGRFFVPSGFLLIVMMLVNLTAAHLLRMRIQASGGMLVGGFMVMMAGAVATWFVVLGGQNPSGFQASHGTAFYYALWIGVQLLMLVLAQVVAVFAWRMPMGQTAARIAGWFGAAAIFGAALAMLTSGQNAFIGDSAMRILWQLIQGAVVAAITLVGCYMVFRRKGGVVLVHIGITMLLGNEIYVTLTNEEQQMHLNEGQTSSFAVDIRSAELYVADMRDPDAVTLMQIPGERLAAKSRITDAELPFELECIEWHANSDLVRVPPDSIPAATDGFGQDYRIEPLPVIDGVSGEENQRNWAAGVIRLYDRKSKELIGVHLISQLAEANGVRDTIGIDGTPWQIGLRLKHVYKPYSISLDDASSVNYIGTEIPKTYESTIRLNHAEQGVTNARRQIWMNNPMRYGNETFYQTGYLKLPDGRETSSLQIVKNTGWMIPYVACMYVVIGLMSHFFSMLAAFLAATIAREEQALANRVALKDEKGSDWGMRILAGSAFWVPVLLALVFVGYVVSRAMRPAKVAVGTETMPLDNFARIPLNQDGRIQPLESLARNTARMLGHRETVLTKDEHRVSALRWLADTVFETEGHRDYLLFRIEDLNLLAELGLQPRKGFRYSLEELDQAREKIDRALEAAKKLPEERWSNTQKRMLALSNKIGRVYGIKAALGDPSRMVGGFLDQTAAVRQVASSNGLPLLVPTGLVPTGGGEKLWVTLSSAHWMEKIREYGERAKSKDVNEVADFIVEKELVGHLRDDMIQDQIIETVLRDETVVAMLKKETGLTDVGSIRNRFSQSFADFPQAIKDLLLPVVEPPVDAFIQENLPQWRSDVREMVRGIYGKADMVVAPEFDENYRNLLGLGQAWRDRDPELFDRLAGDHLASVGVSAVDSRTMLGVNTEILLDRLSPFYVAILLYLFAGFCCVLGWIAVLVLSALEVPGDLRQVSFTRGAAWIIWMAVSIHAAGLIMRMIITERPPVTNLYSSFVFVSLAVVVFLQVVEWLTRIGIGSMLGSIFGVLALLWAFSISVSDGDTMIVLRAVLDTPFWLATHVICISFGYAATVVAGLLGMLWIVWSLFLPGMDKLINQILIKLIYGTTAFALLLSFFGTVLGGLWGDDSWGRFWGWDPKENGALMIVLWNAVPLHARWAGIIRDRGIAALSIFGIVVTVWSWECVNQLGVGLHSYGVSASKLSIVLWTMGILTMVSLAGLIPRSCWQNPAVSKK